MINSVIRYKIRVKALCQRPLFIFLWMTFMVSSSAFSQSGAAKSNKEMQHEKRPAYLNIALGINVSSFRDLATSPLIYSGNPLYVSLSHIDINEKRESHFTLSYSFGKFKSNFNQHNSESQANTISLNYLELFEVEKLSSTRFNLKIGGQLNSTVNHRENTELFNNSEAVDVISTLFGSAKGTLDLSRSGKKSGKSRSIHHKVKERMRSISYTMNVGIVNSSYRNGFAYTNPSAPLNEDDFFAGYDFQIFEGFRLNSSLDYTIVLPNKNAIQLSYIWDVYSTDGQHETFEMAAHILKFSLLFGLK